MYDPEANDSLQDRLIPEILETEVIVNFRGAGKKLDGKDDIEPICKALEQSTDVEVFCLQGNTLGSGAAKYLAESLSKCKKMKRLLCEDIFTGRMKTDIPLSLGHFSTGLIASGCQLVELDFSGNAFGELAVNAMFELLTAPTCFTLKNLLLNNTGLGPSGGVRLAEALMKCLEKSNGEFQLEVFVCGRSRLENEGAIALAKFFAKCPALEQLIIPQDGIFKEGIVAIADALTNCPNFQVLNVNDNILSLEGAESLKQYLPYMTNLIELNVGDCVLRSEGAEHIIEGIMDLESLQSINLGHNEIELEAGLKIVEAMANKPNLITLELDGNCFGGAGIVQIERRMEELGKIEALCAFSEDEENHDDEDEDDNEDAFEDFAVNPTLVALKQIPDPGDKNRIYLKNFQCLDHAALLRMFIKYASICDGTMEAVELVAKCCTPIFERIAVMEYDATTLINLFAVHLGFIKDETKTVRKLKDLSGPLLILAQFKSDLPEELRYALKTFVQYMAEEKCSQKNVHRVILAYKSF